MPCLIKSRIATVFFPISMIFLNRFGRIFSNPIYGHMLVMPSELRDMKIKPFHKKDKVSPYKIISISKGKLQFHMSNFMDILKVAKEQLLEKYKDLDLNSLPIAITSVAGGALKNESFFFTNLLVRHLQKPTGECKCIGNLTRTNVRKTKRRFLDLQKKHVSDSESSGILLWPTPFIVDTDLEERRGLLWVLYMHTSKKDNDKIDKRVEDIKKETVVMEKFLALVCSRVFEVFRGGNKTLHFDEMKEALKVPQATPVIDGAKYPDSICESLCVIFRNEGASPPPKPNHFKEAQIIGIDDLSQPLFDKDGKLDSKNLKIHFLILKDIATKLMVKFPPKLIVTTGKDLDGTVSFLYDSEIVNFLESTVKMFNADESCLSAQLKPDYGELSKEYWLNQALQEEARVMLSGMCDEWAAANFFIDDSRFEIHWSTKSVTHFNQVLCPKYRKLIEDRLWEKFCDQFYHKLQNRFKKVFMSLRAIHYAMVNQFKQVAYSSPEALLHLFEARRKKELEAYENEDQIIYNTIVHAVYKMKLRFLEYNQTVTSEEVKMLKGSISKIENFYNQQMSEYQAADVYSPDDLADISKLLILKLIAAWKGCIRFSHMDFLEKKGEMEQNKEIEAELKSRLETAFSTHAELNKEKSERLSIRVKKAIFGAELKYMERMEAYLKEHSEGVAEDALSGMHETVKAELLKILKKRVKEIRGTEPVHVHYVALTYAIDSYWEHVKGKNRKKLEEVKPEHRKLPDLLQSVEAQKPNEQNPETSLVFQLAHDCISCGVLQDGQILILPNEFNESSTPLQVGIIEGFQGNKLVYGGHILSSKGLKIYNVSDLLNKNLNAEEGVAVMETFQIGSHSQELGSRSFKYFLGFLLGRLKFNAKNLVNQQQFTALIAIPTWLNRCPSRRNIIEEAAYKIADFNGVRFINQAWAAVHHFLGLKIAEGVTSVSGKILVLSENFGVLDVTMISYLIEQGKKAHVDMIADGSTEIHKFYRVNEPIAVVKFVEKIKALCKKVVKDGDAVGQGPISENVCPLMGLVLPCSAFLQKVLELVEKDRECGWERIITQKEDILTLQGAIALGQDLLNKFSEDDTEIGVDASEEIDEEQQDAYFSADEEEYDSFHDCDDQEVQEQPDTVIKTSVPDQPTNVVNNNGQNLPGNMPKLSKDKLQLLKRCEEIKLGLESGEIEKSAIGKKMALKTIENAQLVAMSEHSSWQDISTASELLENIAK